MLFRNQKLRIGVGIFMLATMLTLSACNRATQKNVSVKPDEYVPLCVESSDYSLDVDENGTFFLLDKDKNTVMRSAPDTSGAELTPMAENQILSALIIECYYKDTGGFMEAYSYPSSVMSNGLVIKKEAKEIIAEYYFETEQIKIPVHYTLDGKKVLVTIIPEEIENNGSGLLTEIALHPYFGGASGEETGFLFVPDGSGAVIEYNQTVANEYKQPLYSKDQSIYSFTASEKTKPAVMTAFGSCINAKGAYLGIVTMGAADASVSAIPGNDIVGYNAVYPFFTVMEKDIRDYPDDHRLAVDIIPDGMKDTGPLQVLYSFAATETPSYMDLATEYREYLVKKYGLTKRVDSDYPISLDITMSSRKTKTFLGVPYDGIETLTTAEQAQEIVTFFKDKKIPTIVRLNNWSKQTAREKAMDGYTRLSSLGTASEYAALFDAAVNNGKLYLNGKLLTVSGGSLFEKSNTYAQNMQDAPMTLQQYNLVTRFSEESEKYFLSNASVRAYAAKYAESFQKINDKAGVAFEDTALLYTDFSADKKSLTATEKTIGIALKSFSDRSIAVSGGAEYTLGYADHIFAVPMSDSGYDCVSYSVPFYQIVLHGYLPFSSEAVNASANPERAMLKALESGALLHFNFVYSSAEAVRYSENDDLYSASFAEWKEISAEKYAEYAAILKDNQNKVITGHKRLAPGVTYTEYEDGNVIIVNCSDCDYTYDGTVVKAMGYLERKGEK